MNKYIENATLKIVQRMEKNRQEYEELRRNYNDTGYDRYKNKMDALDVEYEEFKAFIGVKEEQNSSDSLELERLRDILKNIKSKIYYMEFDFPDNSHLIGLKRLLNED